MTIQNLTLHRVNFFAQVSLKQSLLSDYLSCYGLKTLLQACQQDATQTTIRQLAAKSTKYAYGDPIRMAIFINFSQVASTKQEIYESSCVLPTTASLRCHCRKRKFQ